jgi:hypothetical protein
LHLSAGRWVGGWGAETDQLGAEVCVTRSARHGWMLAGRELGCRDASSHRRLGGWFTGAYVSALDARRREMACVQGLATSATLICRGGSSVPRWGALDGAQADLWTRAPGGDDPAPRTHRAWPRAGCRCPLRRPLSSERRCQRRPERRLRHGQLHWDEQSRASRTGLAPGPVTVEIHVDDGPLLRGHSRV